MTHAQSQGLAAVGMLAIWISAYLIHLAVRGVFALPAGALAVLVPLTPVIDQLAAWALHGLNTGQWDAPLPPIPARVRGLVHRDQTGSV